MTVDDEVWKLYAKGVKKIGKAKAPKNPQTSSRRKPGSSVTSGINKISPASSGKTAWIPASAGMTSLEEIKLDRRAEKNMRQGDIQIEARIDLHGMTQAEAYDALARFMASAVKAGKRTLLVITGKGSKGDGVLRNNLPNWLQSLPEASRILALRPASPKHGGGGAFYILLKKRS